MLELVLLPKEDRHLSNFQRFRVDCAQSSLIFYNIHR